MPKSRVRKNRRTGRPVRHQAPAARPLMPATAGINQSEVARTINDIDDLLRQVPPGYNPSDVASAVEHHHRCAELVAYMRDHFVLETFAMLAGGELVVLADEPPMDDAPFGPIVSVPLPRRNAGHFDRLPPVDEPAEETVERVRDGLARLQVESRPTTVESVQAAIERTRAQYAEVADANWEDHNRCPVCGRIIQRSNSALLGLARYRTHGPRGNPCAGSGMSFETAQQWVRSEAVRTVTR